MFLRENRGYLIHLISFFSGGHRSTHCFKYLGHFCIHFFSSSLFFLFSLVFMDNFCIAPCLFSATELCERYQQELGALIWWMEKPNKHVFVLTPSVGVKHFGVHPNGMACFCAYPQCRSSAYISSVYVTFILRA